MYVYLLRIFAIIGLVAGAYSQQATDQNIIPLIRMDNVPLRDAIANLARQADFNYIMDPSVPDISVGPDGKLHNTVTINWEKMTAKEALARLAKENGLQLIETADSPVTRIAPTNQPVTKFDASLLGKDSNSVIPFVMVDSAPLDAVVAQLTRGTDLKLLVDPKVSRGGMGPDGRPVSPPMVSVRWKNITARQAIAAICQNFDLALVKDGDAIRVTKMLPATSRNPALPALPSFRLYGVVLKAQDLKYRPHDDVIHPSVLPVGRHINNALGKFYIYYAPHDAPGGICIAFADKPEGPWREYTNNPIISREWAPHYKVSHVSAPEAIWNEEEKKVFLYFHGENSVQRLASSADGIHFDYEREVLTTSMVEEGVTEVCYGRVFSHTLPGKDNRYIQFFLGNRRGTRLVYLAWSKDGREWQTRRTPVLELAPGTTQIADAIYFPWKGRHYLIFHGHSNALDLNTGVDLYAAETDPGFERVKHLGVFMDRKLVSPTNDALMAPTILQDGGKYYLYFNIGKRLNNQIALAIADGRER